MHLVHMVLVLLSMAIMDMFPAHVVADSTTPGPLEMYSTVYSIGFEWNITGDENHNAQCTVQYRVLGSGTFHNAMPLYRVDYQGYNTMAGSLFFLEPGTTYEIQLSLTDPDGGGLTITDTTNTRSLPVLPTGGNTYHVQPGNGGGNGSLSTPFLGIEAAEAAVGPGDICLLHAGNYGGVNYLNTGGTTGNPIVWTNYGNGPAVFEGIRIETDHIWLDGLHIIDQQYGLRTSPPGPVNIIVTNCHFDNNHYSIFLNDGGNGWYIADNTIIGDNEPGASDFSGEGIELQHTSDHTVAYNTISRVADGISYPHKNVDMLGNDIYDTSDDGIEFDYGHANNRAWRNRITNTFNNGISFQPQNGAPYYVMYNQVAVLNTQSVLKLRDRSDRALIAHNTMVCNSGPMAFGSHFLIDFEIKNNLWISINDRYAWENGVLSGTTWKTDFDHDGFDWGNYPYAFKWGERLDDIQEFYDSTGQEINGIEVDHTICFDSLNYTEDPLNPGTVDSFHIQFYTLDPACNAVDAGTPLPNVNENFQGSAPDLGAYEIGNPLPHFGRREICYTTKTNTWIGPNIGTWYADTAYWNMGRFPDYCDHVVIPSGKIITVPDGDVGYARSLTIEGSSSVDIQPAGELHIRNQ